MLSAEVLLLLFYIREKDLDLNNFVYYIINTPIQVLIHLIEIPLSQSDFINLFSLNISSGIPIYRQLIDQIKQGIRMQLLKTGDKLPSVRSLATNLQINPMTISKAFAQLELEGVLLRKRGVGMLVAEAKEKQLDPVIEKSILELIEVAKAHQVSDEDLLSVLQQYLSIETTVKNV